MLDGLRAEFPGAFRVLGAMRIPPIARTTPLVAFVAALGASFLVGTIAELAVLALYPTVFPPTREQPLVSLRDLWEAAGALAAGAVATRAGGIAAFLLYVIYELAILLAALPGAVLFCSRSGPLQSRICDYGGLIVDRWPLWLTLAIGAVLGALLVRNSRSGNLTLLRAAGFASLCITIGASLGSLWQFLVLPSATPSSGGEYNFISGGGAFWLGWLIGGAVAGASLANARAAAPLLLALLFVAPSLASGAQLIRGQIGTPTVQPFFLFLAQWAWLWLPLAASVAMFVSRELARRRNRVLSPL